MREVVEQPEFVEKKEPKELGREAMKELLDRYNDDELKLIIGSLSNIQETNGCVENCSFCALNPRHGVQSYFNADAIKYFWQEREIDGVSLGQWFNNTNGRRIILYHANEPFGNPDYLKIAKLFDLNQCGYTSTSYPRGVDQQQMAKDIVELSRFGHTVRISITENNYERLMADGWLKVVNKKIIPTKKSYDVGLSFDFRFNDRQITPDIEISEDDFSPLNYSGRQKEGPIQVHGDNGVILTPNGFFNRWAPQSEDVMKHMIEKTGIVETMRKIKPHFHETEFVKDLLAGKLTGNISMAKILENGVIERFENYGQTIILKVLDERSHVINLKVDMKPVDSHAGFQVEKIARRESRVHGTLLYKNK